MDFVDIRGILWYTIYGDGVSYDEAKNSRKEMKIMERDTMTFFEKELRRFFENNTLIEDKVFVGKVLTGKLNSTTNIKIYWDTLGVADTYPGFNVKIINKSNGVVDAIYVKFSDIIGRVNLGDRKQTYYVWISSGEAEWYSPSPKAAQVKKITDVISDYIKLYK